MGATRHGVLGSAILLAWLGMSASAQANPIPFEATYQLSIDGWPDARISHRLSHQGDLWQSEMQAAIAIAEGHERSRFRLTGQGVNARSYTGSYQLLGFGKHYRLTAADLAELPDRQTALFALSRQADKARCSHPQVAPCTLRYLDYEGDEKVLKYRVVKHDDAQLPAGAFSRIVVDAWDVEKPDRHLIMGFHPAIPGLLLSVEYYRDGQRKSRLTLTRLVLSDDAQDNQQN